MGLDMHLIKKVYVGADYEHNNVTGIIDIKRMGNPVEIDLTKVCEITENVGYWRKANAIHNWFVINCQEGKDECQESYVDREQLTELKGLCEKLLENKGDEQLVNELLPPTPGFFFGSTAIDEYFYQDLEDTVKILDNLEGKGDYYYRASW